MLVVKMFVLYGIFYYKVFKKSINSYLLILHHKRVIC